jgi:putative transposase
MKFAFVHAEEASFSVTAMCRLLGVSRQGYYAYANRPPSIRVSDEEKLCDAVREVFTKTGETYGSPRVLRQLRREGWHISKRRVERAMRSMRLTPRVSRRHVRTTVTAASHAVAPNELARDFMATRPNERWSTDISVPQKAA